MSAQVGNTAAPTVAIVDDHPIAVEGLAAHLQRAGFAVATQAAAVELLDDAGPAPDVVVCDLHLPGRSGTAAVAYLIERGCAVLATTGVAKPEEVLDAVAAGARGFLSKTASPQAFAVAVDELAGGSYHVSPELAHHLLEDARRRPLSRGDLGPAGRAVLQAFERGDSPAEVAAALGVSPEVLSSLLGQVWDAAARRRRRHTPSPRELDVLNLVSEGLTHKELAARLSLSPATLPTILERIKTKYLALNPGADPAISPLTAARRWAADLGIGEG